MNDPSTAGRTLRVVLAEDAVLLREGTAQLLTTAGIDVVGQAADLDQLYAVVDQDPPDVVLTDIRMPPTHTDEGIRATLELRKRYPAMGVLVLSQYLESAYAAQLLADGSGGIGYLLKDRVANVGELLDAVRRVAAGETVIDPLVVSRLIDRRRVRNPLEGLTERERDVLKLMAEGRSNQAISDRLILSPKTVETHVRSIFTKLDISIEAKDHRRVLAVLRYLKEP